MKVKTDYEDCKYITAGKEYECEFSDSTSGYITDDEGISGYILFGWARCSHLNEEGSWSIVE